MQNLLLAVALLICTITDFRQQKIYNMVLLPTLFIGVGYNIVTAGWPGLLQSLLGLLTGLAILFIPFAMGGIGAGDVKLLGVIGALKGAVFVFYAALGMGLAGGIMALAVLAYKAGIFSNPVKFLRGLWVMFITGFKVKPINLDKEKIYLPYGLAIAVGAVGAFWWMR